MCLCLNALVPTPTGGEFVLRHITILNGSDKEAQHGLAPPTLVSLLQALKHKARTVRHKAARVNVTEKVEIDPLASKNFQTFDIARG